MIPEVVSRTGAAMACEAFCEAGDATDAAAGLTSKSPKSDSSARTKGEGPEGTGDRHVGLLTGERGRMGTRETGVLYIS